MNLPISRRQTLRLGAAAATAFALNPLNSFSAAKKPNIVFIMADDLGWSDIGYNNPEIKTPNLDRLASEGVKFTHHYAMPTCTPTRVGILTGQFPSRFGVYGPDYGKIFRDDTITLAHALHHSGYKTHISGKWHIGSPPEYTPLKYGFDSSYGYFAGQIDPYTHLYKTGIKTWHKNDKYLEEKGHVTDLITEHTIDIINQSGDDPFFLYVAYSVPHYPLDEPERWTSMYSHIEEPSRRWFNASVTHMDHGIGQIVDALDEKGIRENTLIVFVSDNGGQKSWSNDEQYHGRYADKPHTVLGDNSPLRGWKGDVYEGGIRVPAFVNWKGTLDSDECSTPMHIVDWMPTLCSLAGYPPPDRLNWDGTNLWPNISGKSDQAPDRNMYWSTRSKMAVRDGDWKLIRFSNSDKIELYNLKKDPLEENGIADQHPEKVKQLQKLLDKMISMDNKKVDD